MEWGVLASAYALIVVAELPGKTTFVVGAGRLLGADALLEHGGRRVRRRLRRRGGGTSRRGFLRR